MNCFDSSDQKQRQLGPPTQLVAGLRLLEGADLESAVDVGIRLQNHAKSSLDAVKDLPHAAQFRPPGSHRGDAI